MSEATPSKDTQAGDHHDEHDHVLSWQTLLGTLVALLVLTGITVGAAYVDLGELNIFIAMLIACVKATLVLAIFMHLWWDKPFNTIVFLTSVGMLALFLAIATLDTGTYQWRLDPGYGEKAMQKMREDLMEERMKAGQSPVLYPKHGAEGGADDPAVLAMKGKKLYAACAACHGPTGKGVPNLGKDMTTSKFVQETSDAELVEFIKKGRPADDPANTTKVAMPPKGGRADLTDDDLKAIVAFIRTLK